MLGVVTAGRVVRRGAAVLAVALAVVLVVALVAATRFALGGAPGRDARAQNLWLDGAPLSIAHRGGAAEAPESTLFAYRQALASGADVLEVDLHATSDGELVVVHGHEVDGLTDGTGDVEDLSLAQVQALDAAWWFVPGEGAVRGRPAERYVYRGMATGDRPTPPGAAPEDFRVPTFRQVLSALPDARLAVELKPPPDGTGRWERALVAQLREADRLDDVYVASEHDASLDVLREAAPGLATAAGRGEVARFVLAGAGPLPGRRMAAQVLALPRPAQDPLPGAPLVTRDLVEDAHAAGLAVHVFTVDSCEEMAEMLKMGVDGVYTDVPRRLADVLAAPPRQRSCPRS